MKPQWRYFSDHPGDKPDAWEVSGEYSPARSPHSVFTQLVRGEIDADEYVADVKRRVDESLKEFGPFNQTSATRMQELAMYWKDQAESLQEQYEILNRMQVELRDDLIAAKEQYERLRILNDEVEEHYALKVSQLCQTQEQLEAALSALRKAENDADAGTAVRYWCQEFGVDLNPATSPDPPGAGWHEHTLCVCGGYEAGDHHFDRSLCVCGVMHYYCNRCGSQGDSCDPDPASEPHA